jgi:hypothetical protein
VFDGFQEKPRRFTFQSEHSTKHQALRPIFFLPMEDKKKFITSFAHGHFLRLRSALHSFTFYPFNAGREDKG